MSTFAELTAHRITAGARYLAAVNEFIAARIELEALDHAFMNSKVGGGTRATFGTPPDLFAFRHGEFAPVVSCDWGREFGAALNARIAAFPTQDPE